MIPMESSTLVHSERNRSVFLINSLIFPIKTSEFLQQQELNRCYYNRCAGNEDGEICTDSRDCSPGLYCDSLNAVCQPFKKSGDVCFNDDECGRTRSCKHDNDTAGQGVCTDYFSLADGTTFYVKSEYDVFLCQSMAAENDSKVSSV